MRPPLTIYGGKTNMLKHILPRMPFHIKKYSEPYFGGGAVFFAKSPSFLEVINDVDNLIINFYEVMNSNFDQLNKMIDKTLLHESLHKKAYNIIRSPKGYSKIQRAWAIWFSLNFSFANKIGGGFGFDNATDGGHAGRKFENRKEEFNQYKNRLKNVQIMNRPAMECLNMRNSIDWFHFLDPPYPRANQGHYKKTGFSIYKLVELLDYLENSLSGKFMLCNYYQPEIKPFLNRNPNWLIEYFDMPLTANGKSRRSRKTEIIIRNYTNTPTLF